MLIDSHAHLNFKDFAVDFDEVVVRAKEAGVEKIINIGTSITDAQEVINLAQKYDFMYATVGIHPNDDPTTILENIDWKKFEKLATSKKVIAIGECGLDYSRSDDKERQKKLFNKQIEIAGKVNLPLSIHIRDAQDDAMEILGCGQNDRNLRGVFHCFSGDQKYLDYILNKLPNFYISFAGNITFPPKADQPRAGKNAKPLRDLVKLVPMERLMVETDSPFLAPEPHRGEKNTPANVKIVAEKLAEIKGVHFEKIAEETRKNAKTLFII